MCVHRFSSKIPNTKHSCVTIWQHYGFLLFVRSDWNSLRPSEVWGSALHYSAELRRLPVVPTPMAPSDSHSRGPTAGESHTAFHAPNGHGTKGTLAIILTQSWDLLSGRPGWPAAAQTWRCTGSWTWLRHTEEESTFRQGPPGSPMKPPVSFRATF